MLDQPATAAVTVVLVGLVGLIGASSGAAEGGGKAARELRLYVAPDGDDSWSGRKATANAKRTDGPFATVERARDEIRRMKAAARADRPVTVMLRGGVHRLNEPLVFGPEDSGTAEAPVTYCAYVWGGAPRAQRGART